MVFVDAVLHVPHQLQFLGLTFDQFGIGGSQQADRLLGEVSGCDLGGPCHEEVTGEDGNAVRPIGVDRWGAAPGVRFVDDVVVVERPDVDQLDGHPGFHRAMAPGVGPELGSEEGEQRAKPLAPGEEEMLGDLGQVRVVGGGGLEQPLLHPRH